MSSARDRLTLPLAASLTLGLAPFTPQPHVVEKLRWLAEGGAGMRPLDVFDLVLHGSPWVWLAWVAVQVARGTPAAPPAPARPSDRS
ncbi:MAG: hypothetical protein H6732_14425 [Alphaproteobacteria bacterium]|nr:hypothetical protein [Alphaproteobacteria bacterium]